MEPKDAQDADTRPRAGGRWAAGSGAEPLPRSIGGFELMGSLGRGAMGVVFKARQTSMDRVVALKVLAPRLTGDRDFVERFMREAHAAARLNHPNIVQAIDVGHDGGHYYFAMEFVDGTTLRELLRREGRLREARALEIVADVAHALDHAHHQGIVHRDIKPDNIMLTRDGEVKLADLGLARLSETPDTLTADGATLGTPYYMSPEHVRGRADIDIRADIYSLGATLFEMVTGDKPFEAPNSLAVIAKHLNEPPPSPREKNPELSDGLCHLVQAMMAKDRERRPATPADLLAAIHKAQRGSSVRAAARTRAKLPLRTPVTRPPSRRARSRRAPVRRPRRRSSAGAWAVAGLVLAAFAAGAVALAIRHGRVNRADGGRKAPDAAIPDQPTRVTPRAAPPAVRPATRATPKPAPPAVRPTTRTTPFDRARAQLSDCLLKRDLPAAVSLLEKLEAEGGLAGPCLAEFRATLVEAAKDLVAQLDMDAAALCEQGRFDEAERGYREARGWGVEAVRAALDEGLARIGQARRDAEGGAAADEEAIEAAAAAAFATLRKKALARPSRIPALLADFRKRFGRTRFYAGHEDELETLREVARLHTGADPPNDGTFVLTVQAPIDGDSTLVITPGAIHWEHKQRNRPGTPRGARVANAATVLNGKPWYPVWRGRGNTSEPIRSRAIPRSFAGLVCTVTKLEGRGKVTLRSSSARRVAIRFLDNAAGADAYEARIVLAPRKAGKD